MATRVVHRVRCRKKDNRQVWADVKVVDAVSFIEPGGQERLQWVKATDAVPCIVDKTKAKPSFETGSPDNCTRLSHMELVTGQDDSSQKMYIEVLDALVFSPPVDNNADEAQGGARKSVPWRHGLPEAARFGKGQYALFLPDGSASKFIVDNVGLGLAEGSQGGASRSAHINLVTEKGNTDDKTDAADAIPPQTSSWVATSKPDAINFKVPGGDITMILPRGAQEEIDSTQMTTDPDTGDPCPPDNTDPNVYVSFPQDATGDPNAPTVGCNLKIPTRTQGSGPIDQGPLWWIERISSPFQPWFWYADVQSPKAFSFFAGGTNNLSSWAYRGFMLFNYYPVIWILSVNNPLLQMGSLGSPSLDICARRGNWDFGFPPVPNYPMFVPPRPVGALFPFSGLTFAPPIINDLDAAAHPTYGPFGCLQMTHPPLGPFPGGVPYGNSLGGNDGSQIWSGTPNIFQLTGLPQPKRADMTKDWHPSLNPILPPTVAEARIAATTFRDFWNSSANGHNNFLESYVGDGKDQVYAIPPGWSWAVSYYDPFTAATPGLKYYGGWRAGIPPGVATGFSPLVDFIPATAWTLQVDQLDQKTWDTTKLEMFSNPNNWFADLVAPPLLKPGAT